MPDYLSQSAEKRTDAERRQWFVDRSAEAYGEGCELVRMSYHPSNVNLIICEGWKNRRAEQGEINWQMEAT